MDSEEGDLVRRCLDGDEDACTDLVARYARMVGTIVWRATGDSGVVEDLAQEAFLRVFRGLGGFSAESKLSTWICTIAHRVAIDHLRKVGRWRENPWMVRQEDTEAGSLDSLPASAVVDPEAAAIQTQVAHTVRQALASLPDKYRLPLLYAAIDGLDYRTIGVMLGVPVGTVKTLVFRAKVMLKTRIATATTAASDKS